MNKKSKLNIVFLLIILPIFAGNLFADTYSDSLKIVVEKEKNANKKLSELIEITKHLSNIGNKEAIVFAEQSIKLADSLNDYARKNEALILKGTSWQIWGNNAKAIESFFKALIYFKKHKKHQQVAETLRKIGESYRAAANLDKAIEYLTQAEQKFIAIKDSYGLARTYNRMAAVYFEIAFNHPIFRNDTLEEKPFMAVFNGSSKESADLVARYDSTYKYIFLSNTIAKQNSFYDIEVSTNIILGSFYNTFFKRDSAFIVLNDVVKMSKKYGITMDITLSLYNLAAWYYTNKDYDNAMIYAMEAYNTSVKNEIKAYIYLTAGLVSFIYQKQNKFKQAHEFTRISMEERMDYFNKDIEATIVAFEYESKINKIEQEISFSKKEKNWILITFISILSITAIFLFFFIRKKLKEKKLLLTLQEQNKLIGDQKEKLEQMNAEKDKFFSIIAHDLKNPIGAIKLTAGYVDEYYDDMPNEEVKDTVRLIKESSDNVTELLENLLEWSRSQSGKISFHPVEADVFEIARLNVNLLKASAENKGITILNDLLEKTNCLVDVNMLNTVFRNLISNAIKFTPNGGTIEIGFADAAQPHPSCKKIQPNHFCVFIKDSGVGISQDVINKLFRIDETITTTGTSGEKGTGLGLILCKEFIELNNGTIAVESELQKGSTFFITLPSN